MRENPDGFPSSRVGFAEALLPFRYKDGLVRKFLLTTIGSDEHKVTAGLKPADLATMELAIFRF